jgi:hypothetical protein
VARVNFLELHISNKVNDKDSRAFRIQNFLHKQKLQNKGKYGNLGVDNSKIQPGVRSHAPAGGIKGAFSLQVPKGTISILSSKTKANNLFTIKNYDKFISEKSMFKTRWKVAQWLFHERKDGVNGILSRGKKLFKKFCGNEGDYVRNRFSELEVNPN